MFSATGAGFCGNAHLHVHADKVEMQNIWNIIDYTASNPVVFSQYRRVVCSLDGKYNAT